MRILILVIAFILGACSRYDELREVAAYNDAANKTFPQNYRSEILTLLRTYLNDPTQVRDAFISDPAIMTIDGAGRYAVCVRYNAKKSNGQYASSKDGLMTFRDGRLDRILDPSRNPGDAREIRQQCKDIAMKPFPELEHLSR